MTVAVILRSTRKDWDEQQPEIMQRLHDELARCGVRDQPVGFIAKERGDMMRGLRPSVEVEAKYEDCTGSAFLAVGWFTGGNNAQPWKRWRDCVEVAA